MLLVIVLTTVAAGASLVVYLGYERTGAAGLGMAALRTVGAAALVLLLVNPSRATRARTAPPTVLLDASLSLQAAGGHWREALDTARALAGREGLVLRFGSGVAPFDTLPPADGSTHLGDALKLAVARSGPVVVVTDGEVEDAAALEPDLLAPARVVVLPRNVVADAALLDASAPAQLARGDSLPLELSVGTFGSLTARRASIEVSLDGRSVTRRDIDLPAPPGTARRRIVLGPQAVSPGPHLLTVRLVTPGDAEPRDDQRARWISVAAQPGVVMLAAPADWEARFLARELSDIAPGTVRGFALIGAGRWVDMRGLKPVTPEAVDQAAAGASVVVLRGTDARHRVGQKPSWRWLSGDSTVMALAGEWYVDGGIQPSPLAGRLSGAAWDSVPPLLGIVPVVSGENQWVALSARLGRRGAERPLVLGRDSAGARQLIIAGEGMWRWALRGGAAREAYRSLVAAALDWLLGTGATARRNTLTATPVAARGTAVVFRWTGDSLPDSVQVSLSDGRATRNATLRFDAAATALLRLEPGAYRWTASWGTGSVRAGGQFVVEEYSDEYHPRSVTLRAAAGAEGAALLATHARARSWLFVLVVAALAGEWIWRHRRGLP